MSPALPPPSSSSPRARVADALATPKVLHPIGGRSLLGHALAAARALDRPTSSSS